MDFKIEIMCQRCCCSFELRPVEFKQRTSAECPNCGQAFPEEVYTKLRTGVTTLGDIEEHVSASSDNPFSEGLFSMRVKSFGTLHDLYDNSGN